MKYIDDWHQRRANGVLSAAVFQKSRQRIHSGFAIVRDESPDGHGLYRMGDNTDRGVVDPGRGAE